MIEVVDNLSEKSLKKIKEKYNGIVFWECDNVY